MITILNIDNLLKGLLITFVVLVAYLSYPLFNVLADSGYHISIIMHLKYYSEATAFSPLFSVGRPLWHKTWALILSHLPNFGIIKTIRIIYTTQFLLSFMLVYFASKNIIYALCNSINKSQQFYIAYFCTILFYFSAAYCKTSWVTNSSVGYQITLPISIYLISNIVLIYTRQVISIFDWLKNIALFAIIICFHAMEALYPLTLILFLILANLHKSHIKYKILFTAIIITLLITIKYPIFLRLNQLPLVGFHFTSIQDFFANFHNNGGKLVIPLPELVYISFLIAPSILLIPKLQINKKLFTIIYLYSLFLTLISQIPQLKIIFFYIQSILVARVMSGSLWFCFLPLYIYIIIEKFKLQNKTVIITTVLLAILIILYPISHFTNGQYAGIIDSFYYSIKNPDYLSDISLNDIQKVENYLKNYKCKHNTLFLARPDIGAIVGMIGCYSNFDYTTADSYNQSTINNLQKTYDLIQIPDLFLPLNNKYYDFNKYPNVIMSVKIHD